MLRGSTPITLSQLDISPAIQAGALEQQAAVSLASSINQAVKDFTDKQEEKKQKKMTISALEELVPGMSKEFYVAASTDKDLRNSLIDAEEARKRAESERIGQGGYYLQQFPIEQRPQIAKELGLPYAEAAEAPEAVDTDVIPADGVTPPVIDFDIEGFEFKVSENPRYKQLLDQIKRDPNNPDSAKALEGLAKKLNISTDFIPSYLEYLKQPTPTEMLIEEDEVTVSEPQEATRTARGRLIQTEAEAPSIDYIRGPRGRMIATNIESDLFRTPAFARPSDKRN
jgi:hypothetical protein